MNSKRNKKKSWSHVAVGFIAVSNWAASCSDAAARAAATIDEAYHAAISRSESVAQSGLRVEQIDEQVGQMRGGIFPNVSFNLNHTLQDDADPQFRAFSPNSQTTMNFNVTQPLFRGLREFNALGAAKHLRSASQANRAATLIQLYQDVAASYLGVLSTEQDLKNVEEQLGLYEKRVEELRARAKRGESNQSEVVSAESTQASLSAELRLLEGQLQAGRETFHFLTGLERETALRDPDVIGKKGGPLLLEKYLSRIDSRPDVKAAIEHFEASRDQVSMAWGAHFPTVDAVGNYYLQRPGFLTGIDWDIGIQVKVPIFEGLATQAKVNEAISKRKEAELEVQRTRRAAERQIRSIHSRLSARLDQMTRLRKSAELAKRNTQLLQKDYRRGLARNIDVQTALAEYRISQRGYDQSRFAAQLDMYELQAASALSPDTSKENAP